MKAPPVQVPDVDTFGSNRNRKIRVWKTPRFMACCEVIAKFSLPVDATWKILTHEDNYKIFRDLKRTNPRKYVKKGMFETIYDVDHVTGWSILWMSGEFITRLRVTENRASKSVSFKLLHSDMMRDFDGHWTLQPATQSGLNKLYGKGGSPFDGLAGLFGKKSDESLLEFQQETDPKAAPPPALRGLVRRIAAGAMKRTMDDLDAEAERIRQGKATLEGFEQWAVVPAKKGAKPSEEKKVAHKLEGKTGSLTLSHAEMWKAVADGPLVGPMQALALW